jgi:hypothetical protein
MTGIDREAAERDADAPEFPPWLDLIAPAVGVVGVVAAALEAGGPHWLGVPVSTWIAGLGGVWALLAAWPRR